MSTPSERLTRVLLLAIAGLVLLSPSRATEAAGPWTAQVVDAETGKPLDGAVVLAVWYRRLRGFGVHGHLGYGTSEEVTTDAHGRFTIAARSSFTFNPFVYLKSPRFSIFKPGYGLWRFQGSLAWNRLDLLDNQARHKSAWREFEGDGVVIELPPLKTPEARKAFVANASPNVEIPASAAVKSLEAIDTERVRLGLEPLKEERIRWERIRREQGN